MTFTLKHFDNAIFSFNLENNFEGVECFIDEKSVVSENLKFLPLDLSLNYEIPSSEDFLKWLKHRTIPSNRAYVQNFLAKLGLSEKDTIGILSVSYGLSLNDCFWICPDYEKRSFSKINLYDNRFSTVLASIAFTGYGSYTKSSFRSSPEFTTNGMLAKCWRKIDEEIYLYKSGTEGFANSGLEPYSEYYASQIAQKLELNAISYDLHKWKSRLCSSCTLFTSKKYSFIPTGRLVKEGGLRSVFDFYETLGKEFSENLKDLFIFDALIFNQDRHMGNFGVLVNNYTNKIEKPAPIFDNGLSLFCYAMSDDLENVEKYKKTILPSLYPSFIDFAKEIMGEPQRKKLHKMLDFTFAKHSRYNLDPKRLKIIEKAVKEQAELLIK